MRLAAGAEVPHLSLAARTPDGVGLTAGWVSTSGNWTGTGCGQTTRAGNGGRCGSRRVASLVLIRLDTYEVVTVRTARLGCDMGPAVDPGSVVDRDDPVPPVPATRGHPDCLHPPQGLGARPGYPSEARLRRPPAATPAAHHPGGDPVALRPLGLWEPVRRRPNRVKRPNRGFRDPHERKPEARTPGRDAQGVWRSGVRVLSAPPSWFAFPLLATARSRRPGSPVSLAARAAQQPLITDDG